MLGLDHNVSCSAGRLVDHIALCASVKFLVCLYIIYHLVYTFHETVALFNLETIFINKPPLDPLIDPPVTQSEPLFHL